MLADAYEQGVCGKGLPIVKAHGAAIWIGCAGCSASADDSTGVGRCLDKSIVQDVAGNAAGCGGQGGFDAACSRGQPEASYGPSPKLPGVHPQFHKASDRVPAKEAAAYASAGSGMAFHQMRPHSGTGKRDGSGRASRAAAYDERL
ncbi:hypothetical protein TomTYG75_34500 [Sphingobium sp. TomTYG75]